jgi:Leucine-rich repeat (LRR) protein
MKKMEEEPFSNHTDSHSQEHKTGGENSEKQTGKKWLVPLLAAVVVLTLTEGGNLLKVWENFDYEVSKTLDNVPDSEDDYAIEWKDKALEKAVRNVTGIKFRAIRYSVVKSIRRLDLDNSNISDISALGSLTNLTSLDLDWNQMIHMMYTFSKYIEKE